MEKKLLKNISYVLQFIDSAKFMVSSLSNLGNNRSEGILGIKCKYEHDDKKMWNLYCDCFLELQTLKMI